MSNPISVSIVIVSYNVEDFLVVCISSIYKFLPSNVAIEIIVVDNNSSDETLLEMKKKFPQVILIQNDFNVGFSEANNQGMRIAKGDYIFLLNPDTELLDVSVFLALDYLSQRPTVSIVAPKLLNADRSLQISFWKFPTIFNVILETFFLHTLFKIGQYDSTKVNTIFSADFVSGAALIFRRELTQKVGFLDPVLFWMEDVDFCFRAKKIGQVIYFPESQIIHFGGASSKKNYHVAISNQVISKVKYFRKNAGILSFILSVVFSFLHVISRIVIFAILSPFSKIFSLKLKAYFYTLSRMIKYLVNNNSASIAGF